MKALLGYVSTLLFIFAARSFYQEPLFDASLLIIESWQTSKRSPWLALVSKLVSTFMGGEVMMVLAYVTLQALAKPSRTLYHLIMCLANSYATILLKLILHQPRPFMVSTQIKAISSSGVSTEFGDPSGHTMSCAQVFLSLFLDYLADEEQRFVATKNCYQNKARVWAKKAGFMVVYLTVVSIVGYSRMFNGSHSLDQVVTGALIGIWLAFFGHYALRGPIYCHIESVLSTESESTGDGPKDKVRGAPWKAFGFFCIAFLSTALAYYYNLWTFSIPGQWL